MNRRGLEAEIAIRNINKSYPVSPNAPADVVANRDQWREKLSAAAFEGDAAKTRLEQARQRLQIEIIQKLARGELIAKGFHMPHYGRGERRKLRDLNGGVWN